MMTLDRQGILEDDYGLVVLLLSRQRDAPAYSMNTPWTKLQAEDLLSPEASETGESLVV